MIIRNGEIDKVGPGWFTILVFLFKSQLWTFYLGGIMACYIVHAGLDLLGSDDPHASAFLVIGFMGSIVSGRDLLLTITTSTFG